MPKAKTWEEYKAECEAVAKPGITVLGWVGEWEGINTKLRCICPDHGIWESTSIAGIKRGNGCPSCANASRSKSISTAKKGKPSKLIKGWEHYEAECKVLTDSKTTVLGYVGEWQGVATRLRLHCSLHGEWCTTRIDNFKNGAGCPSCGYITRASKTRASKTRKGWQEYKAECEAIAKPGIKILGWVGEWKGNLTLLHCHCDQHGEWCSTNISSFKIGRSCPGCKRDRIGKWNAKTWEEYFPRIKAIADAKGYAIEGHGEWKGHRTKLKLICPLHGEFNNTSIHNFLSGNGCPICGCESCGKSQLLSDDMHVKEFMSTGKFKEGTTFKRNTHKVDSQGGYSYWDYTCPVCSDDEYVKAGVCNGVFTAPVSQMKKGSLSCRCSASYHFTKSQWEYRLTKECKSRGYVFIGWQGKGWKAGAKFTYKCSLHGEQSTTIANFLQGCGCPICAGKNQQECYLNVVKDENLPVALKVGIARDSSARLRRQNSMNLFQMAQIAVYKFPTVENCKAAERACLSELTCGVLSARELQDGYTETVALTDYDKVVSIYERFGGVRVDALTEEDV